MELHDKETPGKLGRGHSLHESSIILFVCVLHTAGSSKYDISILCGEKKIVINLLNEMREINLGEMGVNSITFLLNCHLEQLIYCDNYQLLFF